MGNTNHTIATHISESTNKIYCVSSKGLFYINKYDQSMKKIIKEYGLSDFGIKKSALSTNWSSSSGI